MKKFNISKTIIIFAVSIIFIITLMLVNNTPNDFLDSQGLKGLSVIQMVEKLEYDKTSNPDFAASISGTELVIVTIDQTYRFPVPENMFYLSFAPYINQTHPCAIHNLVTCRAELKNENFLVTVTSSTGQTLFNQNVITGNHGFAGIWLPRGIEGTITVTNGMMSATAEIQTYDHSDTCLTTLKLN